MNITIFTHSLLSCWNHGNAHFLRGIVTELLSRGHDVRVYEPADSWSFANLLAEQGKDALADFQRTYPTLTSTRYSPDTLNLDDTLTGADLVIVHEWNDPVLIKQLGEHRHANPRYHLLFHDTHHRIVTDTASMAKFDLTHYDGVLAFGQVIRDLYLEKGWAKQAWTWHEAADTRVFHPIEGVEKEGDLVWIGNWGDEERTAELHEFLLGPVKKLGLTARVYGVRYPDHALRALEDAGIQYGGWLPNYDVPQVFARHRVTVHVPRGPYVRSLPGIPTIRPFEALACGIPLVSSPWDDAEKLFTPCEDILMVENGEAMTRALERILSDSTFAKNLADHGRETINARHTCAHRIDELLAIAGSL
ncbi:MAG: glycosyltransferase [Armatimonadota bacterium]